MDLHKYEVTDSEDNYSDEDKLLLEDARSSIRKEENSSDEEVYGFGASESDEDEDDNDEEDGKAKNDSDLGSDLEDAKKLPDDRAWGKKKKSFYSTDFVDQDYEGIYQGKEAEIAELEEQEAKNIQKRLVEQLNDADFSINEAIDIAEASETTVKEECLHPDLSKLTKRQKLDLLKKESPEFFLLIEDYKQKLLEAQKFLPVVKYFENKFEKYFPALKFLQTKLLIILNYCTNISFYLYLKAKRIPVKNHPVLRSLFRYRQLLQQIQDTDETVIKPQLENILKLMKSGKDIPLDEALLARKTLKLLSKSKQVKVSEAEKEEKLQNERDKEKMNSVEIVGKVGEDKRAITYEMAKNKGLTPKRSKEQRNPRVKHRRKYEKAKIRRRGQMRIPRKEIPVYGGEPTGIKIGLTKSIKIKY